MNKTVKKITMALVLAVILTLGISSAAFAGDNGDPAQLRNSSYDGTCDTCTGDGPIWSR